MTGYTRTVSVDTCRPQLFSNICGKRARVVTASPSMRRSSVLVSSRLHLGVRQGHCARDRIRRPWSVSTPKSRHEAPLKLRLNSNAGTSSADGADSKMLRTTLIFQLVAQYTTSQVPSSAKTMLASSDSIINSCGLKRQLSDTSSVHACTEPGCKRQFTRKYTLMEHAKTHTGERTHICPVRTCGKSFSTSGNLSRHKRLHGYIEPLKCPLQGCICTFPSNNKLEKHMKFHYGMANKICVVPGCGKTFTTTGNLNRHLKNQHSHKQEKTPILPVTMDLPAFNHGASSPTSAEQWFSLPTTAVDSLWSEDVPSWTSSSSTELFEDVWNPVLLDTLVNILDGQSTFSC